MALLEMEASFDADLTIHQLSTIANAIISHRRPGHNAVSIGLRYGERDYEHSTDFDALVTIDKKSVYVCVISATTSQCNDTITSVSDGLRLSGVSQPLQEL